MNILFFGGSSFASQDLIVNLSKKNNVYNLSRKKVAGVQNIYFDINDYRTYEKLKKLKKIKFGYIFYFTSFVPLIESKSVWKKCSQTNIYSLIKFLNKFNFKVKKIILASSSVIYGSQKAKLIDEKKMLIPNNSYSLSKFFQENILRIFCFNKKIKFLSFRIGYVIGKNMKSKRVVIKIINQLKNNKKINIYNGKKTNLNLVHTKDISEIIIKIYKKAEGIYNLCNPKFFSLNEYVKSILKYYPKSKKNVFYFNKKSFTKNSIYSVKKLKNNFNIFPKITLKKNLKNYIN